VTFRVSLAVGAIHAGSIVHRIRATNHARIERKETTVIDTSSIKPHMPVVCSQGGQFATVDHLEGEGEIKLAKDGNGQHHYIPTTWVTSVDDKVHVDRPGDRAMREWSTGPSRHDLAREAQAVQDPTKTERVRSGQQDPKADPEKDPQRAERLKTH
jgi:hypothetical protein